MSDGTAVQTENLPLTRSPQILKDNFWHRPLTRREFLNVVGATIVAFGLLEAVGFWINTMANSGKKTGMPVPDVGPNPELETVLEKFTHKNDGGERILTLTKGRENVGRRILDVAESGIDTEIPSAHPAALLELECINVFAKQTPEQQQKVLETYAKGIVAGLKTTYGDSESIVIALDLGHQSYPSENSKNLEKIVHAPAITLDNGAQSSDGKITEKELNLKVGRLIIEELKNQNLAFVPVLVADETGYENGPLHSGGFTRAIIDYPDINVPLLYFWEHMAQDLQRKGFKMARFCMHFNDPAPDANANMHGGELLTQGYGNFSAQSQNLGKIIGDGISMEVKKIEPDYTMTVDVNTPADAQSWHLAAGPDSVANKVMKWLVAEAHNVPHDPWNVMMSKL